MLKISCLAIALGAAFQVSADDPSVKLLPFNFGAAQEWGMLESGLYKTGNANAVPVKNDWVDHFTAYLSKTGIVNDRLFITAGLGGVFQYRKPENVNAGFSGSQHKSFFIGPSTEAVYHLGDPEKPWGQIGVGNWFYKYDSEAFDLGEYLFRSAAYPTYTLTGGYNVVGSASAQLQGLKGLFRFGDFRADLFLITQTGYAPLYDWSPAAVLGYSLGGGVLDLGAGVNFNHLIEVKPSRSAVHNGVNGYFTAGNGQDYSTNSNYYHNRQSFDIARGNTDKLYRDSVDAAIVDSVLQIADGSGPAIKYFDAKSILMMGRATLDPKKFFETEIFGAEDLKLYGEVGVLGLQDRPVFYQKVTDRMPMMIGFNIPTFKLLDLFAVQMEYMHSPWINNTYNLGNFAANVPYFPISGDSIMSKTQYNDMANRDNVKWAVFLKKSFGRVSLAAQAASDHLRLTSSEYYYGPQFDHGEITVSKKDWYFMTQIAWGM